jgi:hypothetical protein
LLLEVFLMMGVKLNLSLNLCAVVSLVLNLILDFKEDTGQLLVSTLEVGYRDLTLLMSPQHFKLLVVKGLFLLLKVQSGQGFLLELSFDTLNFLIELHSIMLRAVVVAHMGDEGACVNDLKFWSDAGKVEVLGNLHGQRIA